MKSLSINGQKLHEVQMLLVPFNDSTISYLQYPKHRINYQVDEDMVLVKIPSMLVLELFRTGVLDSDGNREVTLEISGKKIGKYTIDDFRYSMNHNDTITIRFKKNEYA